MPAATDRQDVEAQRMRVEVWQEIQVAAGGETTQ